MKKQIKQLENDVVDRTERKALMKSHYESVVQEIHNSQLYQNSKKQEILQYESQISISQKEQQKIKKEQQAQRQENVLIQERLNKYQIQIFEEKEKAMKIQGEMKLDENQMKKLSKKIAQKEQD